MTEELQQQIISLATDLGVDPNWIAKVAWIESRFNPQALNKYSGASGLFQFMPSTAQWLGTNTAAIRGSSITYQFKLFRKYLDGLGFTKGKINSQADMYLAVFFPAAVGKPSNFNLQAAGVTAAAIAKANPAFDYDRNNIITKQEIEAYVSKA